jgi:hypothetical protein
MEKFALAALALALVPAACQAPLRSAHAGGYYYAPASWVGPAAAPGNFPSPVTAAAASPIR